MTLFRVIFFLTAILISQSGISQSTIDANFDESVDHAEDLLRTAGFDEILAAATDGVMSFSKIRVDNHIDGVSIPMYVFEPLPDQRGSDHPALVWVYGGVHDYFGLNYYPFIKEAVEQGYAVIAPEYRGASGYGSEYYSLLDYGGMEVEDIVTAGKYIAENFDYVDDSKIGAIGWSHGGYISLLSVLREQALFSAVVASVPVSNLIFRLSYKGPEYQEIFINQPTIAGLPHEKRELYLQRSPSHLVDALDIPLMAHFATNDDDVDYVEAQLLINALEAKKPDLSEIVIYENPENGHYLNRQTNTDSLTRVDDAVQIDSWNKIWEFLNRQLKR